MRNRGPVHSQCPHLLQPVCGAVLGVNGIAQRAARADGPLPAPAFSSRSSANEIRGSRKASFLGGAHALTTKVPRHKQDQQAPCNAVSDVPVHVVRTRFLRTSSFPVLSASPLRRCACILWPIGSPAS